MPAAPLRTVPASGSARWGWILATVLMAGLIGSPVALAAGDAEKAASTQAPALEALDLPKSTLEIPGPKITGVMPFSSCSPGGAVILKGENFGSQPGTLRLVGHFPGPYVPLEKLEWTSGSVGGQVPQVTGALDQEVKLQVVRKDGKASNPWKCQFEANRVTKRLSGALVKLNLCYMGENAGMGCLADSDIDLTQQLPSGCWHRNNKCGLPTDRNLYGTDEIRTVMLENGWRFKKVSFQQPQFSDTSDKGVNEVRAKIRGKTILWDGIQGGITDFAVDAKIMKFFVPWEVPRGDIAHYLFGFDIEGPEGVPWDEPVSLPSGEQTLDDWSPYKQMGPADVVIVAPAEGKSLAPSGGRFELVLDAAKPDAGWWIELEWIRHTPGKDPSIEPYTVPQGAPRQVRWTQLPAKIQVEDLGGLGPYSVRARVKGASDASWTPWRKFTLIAPKTLASLAKTGGAIGNSDGQKLQAETAAVGPSAGSLAGAQKQAVSSLVPAAPDLSFHAPGARVVQPSGPGAPFGVEGVSVRNGGAADAPDLGAFVEVACESVGSGKVRTLVPKLPLRAIAHGQTHALGLAAACKAKRDGHYRMTLTLRTPNSVVDTWKRDIRIPDPGASTHRKLPTTQPKAPTMPGVETRQRLEESNRRRP